MGVPDIIYLYIWGMFVRKKKNASGSISVQIIAKKSGKYKVVETIGCSKDEKEIEELVKIAQQRIKEIEPNLFDYIEYKENKNRLKADNVRIIGDELVFGKIFKDLGCLNLDFKRFKDKELFKALVISRILYPGSKLYLIDYYRIYKKETIDKNRIYRFLDRLYKTELKEQVEKCVYESTLKKVGGKLVVCFYDVTTLYFESESEDDLRKIGFSKEGKLNRPQIQLGLFTTTEGYPLAYDIYEGNKFEGHTLKENLQKFQKRFNLQKDNKPIVVADRGMLNRDNLTYLEDNGYTYIIGAKIKNLSNEVKTYIANLNFQSDDQTYEIYLDENNTFTKSKEKAKYRLILSYSIQRMKKDRYLREKHLNKLKQKIENSPNLTKNDLKSPYKKYLDLENENIENKDCKITFKLNEEKIKLDEKLDGIKGYITNNFKLSHNEIISHYTNLYFIEEAFRISKTDLRIRPVYHRLEDRIKAHILISFVAYAVYKEFERRIKKSDLDIKFKLTFDYIKTMYGYKTLFGVEPMEFNEIQNKIIHIVNNYS